MNPNILPEPHIIDTHVGDKVRSKRILLGLSQTQVAEQLNITFQQLQKYERGYNRISAGCLYNLAMILNEPISYFFDGIPERQMISHLKIEKDSSLPQLGKRDISELVKSFHNIQDTNIRKQIIDLIRIVSRKNSVL